MRCSDRRHALPIIDCSTKAGQMPFESFIRTSGSIPTGIISEMLTAVTRVCASITYFSTRQLRRDCEPQALIDTYVAGKKPAITRPLGLHLRIPLSGH